jgi:predicted nuclease of restriction endonuclease-like (RecB) superfamily
MNSKRKKRSPETRLTLGRSRGGEAQFPVPPTKAGLPADYAKTLESIKRRIRAERLRTVLSANSAMVLLYWDIGQFILYRQEKSGWGARVIDRMAFDLHKAFPDMQGFSPRNLKYMRAFSAAWPERAIVQGPLAQITWYQNVALLEKLDNPKDRLWYARAAAADGWSRDIMVLQIEQAAHRRQGKAINNFKKILPPAKSEMAAQVFKDPYLFDFLGTADPRREKEVEQALVDHVQQFLLELGTGFAFVGRQVLLEVGDQDFRIDLLFYHLKLNAFVVVELKAVPFSPAFVGQLNLYLSAADDLLRRPGDNPTIGLLLCRSKNKVVVEYALRHLKRPIGVSEWETRIAKSLPKELRGSLPTVEELEKELEDDK